MLKFSFGIIFVGLLLFLPAKTFHFFNAWLFIGLLFIPMFILGIFLFIKSPELLEKRLNAKEKEKTQKGVVGFSAILFLASFLIAGFDFHFVWSKVPFSLTFCTQKLCEKIFIYQELSKFKKIKK